MFLQDIIRKYEIQTMLDIPCGDANWVFPIFEFLEKYVGADIVEKASKLNSEKYSKVNNVQFVCKDITTDSLEKFDLVMTRDLLMHLSNENVSLALANLKASGSKYLLVSCDRNVTNNDDTFKRRLSPHQLNNSSF